MLFYLVDFGVFQEDGDDVDESNHTEDEKESFVSVWGLNINSAQTNHKMIRTSDFICWNSGKVEMVPKHEWGGKNPVDISSPVDSGEGSGNSFDPHATSSGEHLKK